jgi:hypothetical protein
MMISDGREAVCPRCGDTGLERGVIISIDEGDRASRDANAAEDRIDRCDQRSGGGAFHDRHRAFSPHDRLQRCLDIM